MGRRGQGTRHLSRAGRLQFNLVPRMGGPLALCCPPGPAWRHAPRPLLSTPHPCLGSWVDSDSQPFPLPARACSQERGGGSRLQLPPGRALPTAAAAQGAEEAGQLPQDTQAHPCRHRNPGPLRRGPVKTRSCTVVLNGHLSRHECPRPKWQCQNLPPTQTSHHALCRAHTCVCTHTPTQAPPGSIRHSRIRSICRVQDLDRQPYPLHRPSLGVTGL